MVGVLQRALSQTKDIPSVRCENQDHSIESPEREEICGWMVPIDAIQRLKRLIRSTCLADRSCSALRVNRISLAELIGLGIQTQATATVGSYAVKVMGVICDEQTNASPVEHRVYVPVSQNKNISLSSCFAIC